MAWGMMEPVEFGPTFPCGNFGDHNERLDTYFNSELTESERKEFGRVTSFRRIISRKYSAERDAMLEHEMPRELHLERAHRSFADLMISLNALLVVSGRLKNLIEEFEMGIHQFWPMRYFDYRGDQVEIEVYGMVIRQFRDSAIPDQSDWDPNHGKPPKWYFSRHNFGTKKNVRLTLNRANREGAHLWRERRWVSPNLFLSDELQSAIKEQDLRIFKHYRASEI